MLKLELERLRLSRWGEKVHINLADPNYVQIQLTLDSCTDTGRAREVLTLVLDLFRDSEKVANQYRAKNMTHLAHTSTTTRSETMSLYQKAREMSIKQRQKGTSTLRKATWVLYDRAYLCGLLKDLGEMISKLEELVSITEKENSTGVRSSEGEITPWGAKNDIVSTTDPQFQEALKKKGKGHLYYNMKVGENAQVYNGDLLVPGDKPRGRGHVYLNVKVDGNCKVRFGNDQTGGMALLNM